MFTSTLIFTPGNYGADQTATVTPVDDNDTRNENTTVTLTAGGVPDATVSVSVADDDVQAHVLSTTALTVIEEGVPGTFTQGPVVANGPEGSAQSVEFDGTGFGVFAADSAGVVYTRLAEDFSSTLVNTTTTVISGVDDFWPTWNGTEYGVIYRQPPNNNLFFKKVNTNGTVTSPVQVTTATVERKNLWGSDEPTSLLDPRIFADWALRSTQIRGTCLALALAIDQSRTGSLPPELGALAPAVLPQELVDLIGAAPWEYVSDGLGGRLLRSGPVEVDGKAVRVEIAIDAPPKRTPKKK